MLYDSNETEKFYIPLMPFFNLYSPYTWTCHLLMHTWPQWPTVWEKPARRFIPSYYKKINYRYFDLCGWLEGCHKYIPCLLKGDREGHEAYMFSIGNKFFSIRTMIKWFPFESPYYYMDEVKIIMITIMTTGRRRGELVLQGECKK